MAANARYSEFLAKKIKAHQPCGFTVNRDELPSKLFDWQKDVVSWGLRQGRCALFLDAGLGKTAQQLAWAEQVWKHTGKPVLVLCPLAVGPQTCREAAKFGVGNVQLCEDRSEIVKPGIYVTNYHKLHKFDDVDFGGVVLDESSILKSHDGTYRTALIERFARTPYRLAASATPSPNDYQELGNHAEFLGICSMVEMLATYFNRDASDTNGEWGLKRHAERIFWEWVGSWAMVMRKPSDLGYECEGYDLPKLNMILHEVSTDTDTDRLFVVGETSLNGQRKARRDTMDMRIAKAVELTSNTSEPWLVWCELNDEGDKLEKAIRDAVQVSGKQKDEIKVDRITGFSDGRYRILISKPSLTGHGLNWQHCCNMVFVGLSHSFEQFYQASRRCWRYGQTREVNVHIITSDRETPIVDNVMEKMKAHDLMFSNMVKYTSLVNRSSLNGYQRLEKDYDPKHKMRVPAWLKV